MSINTNNTQDINMAPSMKKAAKVKQRMLEHTEVKKEIKLILHEMMILGIVEKEQTKEGWSM